MALIAMYFVTLHACARGKAISFVHHLSLSSRKFPDCHILASEQLVDTTNLSKSAKKLASLCFESLGKTHECHRYCFLHMCTIFQL